MQLLITPEDFATYRDVGKKIDSRKVNEVIREAQHVDLFDYIGEFLYDVVDNREAPEYQDLLNGSEYQHGGKMYSHIGLKQFLADLTYPRYLYIVNVNMTAFGAQQKYTQDSGAVDRNVLKDIARQAQIDADIKFKSISKYITANLDVFSRYKSSSCGGNNINNFTQQKFSKL